MGRGLYLPFGRIKQAGLIRQETPNDLNLGYQAHRFADEPEEKCWLPSRWEVLWTSHTIVSERSFQNTNQWLPLVFAYYGSPGLILAQSFPALAILAFGAGYSRRWKGRGCPGHCRMFSSTPDLYPLDASSTLPLCDDNQKYLQTLPVRTIALDQLSDSHWRQSLGESIDFKGSTGDLIQVRPLSCPFPNPGCCLPARLCPELQAHPTNPEQSPDVTFNCSGSTIHALSPHPLPCSRGWGREKSGSK